MIGECCMYFNNCLTSVDVFPLSWHYYKIYNNVSCCFAAENPFRWLQKFPAGSLSDHVDLSGWTGEIVISGGKSRTTQV